GFTPDHPPHNDSSQDNNGGNGHDRHTADTRRGRRCLAHRGTLLSALTRVAFGSAHHRVPSHRYRLAAAVTAVSARSHSTVRSSSLHHQLESNRPPTPHCAAATPTSRPTRGIRDPEGSPTHSSSAPDPPRRHHRNSHSRSSGHGPTPA